MPPEHTDPHPPPQTEASPAVVDQVAHVVSPRRISKLVVIAVTGLVLVLLTAIPTAAYFVATDKLDLGNESLENRIKTTVFSLPFVPKPVPFVMSRSLSAHRQVAKNSFDISLSAQSSEFQPFLGSNSVDLQAKGHADYSDPQNPRLKLDLDITKDFAAKIRKADANLYFKIDRVPAFIYPLVGIEPNQLMPILENWVRYDTTPLDTEARRALEKMDKPDSTTQTNKLAEASIRHLLETEIMPALVMTTEKLDANSVYKVVYQPTPAQLDKLLAEIKKLELHLSESSSVLGTQVNPDRPSEIIHDFVLSWWIDQKTYYIRKLQFTMNIKKQPRSEIPTLETSPFPANPDAAVSVAGVISLSDFGNSANIDLPSAAISPEQYIQLFMAKPSNALTP